MLKPLAMRNNGSGNSKAPPPPPPQNTAAKEAATRGRALASNYRKSANSVDAIRAKVKAEMKAEQLALAVSLAAGRQCVHRQAAAGRQQKQSRSWPRQLKSPWLVVVARRGASEHPAFLGGAPVGTRFDARGTVEDLRATCSPRCG